ncbi:hypothetical protein ACOI22_02565 [Glaciecola sp. 2405UD65-10]|uniref:hypothetical protein n=1 Tax=Glaciecola sp. 2405UD65-10 TaxID=3397244 RepID=UPI003B59FD13
MNKLHRNIKAYALAGLILLVISGAIINHVNKPLTNEHVCTIQEKFCTFSDGDLRASVEFEQVPVVEEELFVKIDVDSAWRIQKAWVEGINMYMGKTPVLFEDNNNKKRGVTFLGSCNLSTMQWHIYIEVKNDNTGTVKTIPVLFSTSN